jgi:hypothetical protein
MHFPILPVLQRPFPHVMAERFLPSEVYERLSAAFPLCPPASGPTGYSCFRGDTAYETLMATSREWRAVLDFCQSDNFITYGLEQFRDTWSIEKCSADVARARYVDYLESRRDKQARHLENVILDVNQLWIRLDFMVGHLGYVRARHLDHRRRLLTLLLYFCDAEENRMQGGTLRLHGNLDNRDGLDKVITPRNNLMVAFPCAPWSFHSVDLIRYQEAPRRFVQITISSSIDIW